MAVSYNGLRRQLDVIRARFTLLKSFADSFNVEEDQQHKLQTTLENVKRYIENFEHVTDQLLEITPDADFNDLTFQINEMQQEIWNLQHMINSKIPPVKLEPHPQMNQTIINHDKGPKLPPIQLPEFDGHYDTWLVFKDAFDIMIRSNDTLNDKQKLFYLRQSLTKNAARDYGGEEEDFEALWTAIERRFENKRWLVNKHVQDMFNVKKLSQPSANSLDDMLSQTQKHIRCLKALKMTFSNMTEYMIIHFICSKLDPETRKDWANSLTGTDVPGWGTFVEFLENHIHILQNLELSNTFGQKSSSVSASKPSKQHFSNRVCNVAVKQQLASSTCAIHNNTSHPTWRCENYTKMTSSERLDIVRKHNLCMNCLSPKHRAKDCKSTSCRKCQRRHHTSLHFDSTPQGSTASPNIALPTTSTQATQSLSTTGPVVHSLIGRTNTVQVLLHTALIYVTDANGQKHMVRALLDSASQSNFVTKDLTNKLRLSTSPSHITVSGICNAKSDVTKCVTTTIMSPKSTDYAANLDFLIVDDITSMLPQRTFSIDSWNIPKWVQLADPKFNKSNTVDILVGASEWNNIFKTRVYRLQDDLPTLRQTVFGWVVGGSIHDTESSTSYNFHVTNEQLSQQLSRFWEIENATDAETNMTVEEELVESHFSDTHYRNAEGRYVVRHAFRRQTPNLGDSSNIAFQQFMRLERRLSNNPQLNKDYSEFIKEYEDLQHMHFLCKYDDLKSTCPQNFVLPHHPVVRLDRTTTKTRVVFNASQKSSNGMSLNDNMLVGPVVQHNLIDIVLRFRTRLFAFSADVPKMYRQILLHPDDRRYTLILWRYNKDDPLGVYMLDTVTYGTATAPFQATRALQQLFTDEFDDHPLACLHGATDFYVDDVLSGADTLEECKKLATELSTVLGKGGFGLHKFNSNSLQLLQELNDGHQCDKDIFEDISTKTLGIRWRPASDQFVISSNSIKFSTDSPTKRSIASDVAKLYDPIGLVGPIVVTAKIVLQKLCIDSSIKWDTQVQGELLSDWTNFRNQLLEMEDIHVNRCVFPTSPRSKIQIIGFCDASCKAYGACIYIRTIDNDDKIYTSLLFAKSRIAPIKVVRSEFKQATIPRLELESALLLSKLLSIVTQSLPFKIDDIILFSDSAIALTWISCDPLKLKQYISRRVDQIQKLTSSSKWYHVDTALNPADIISRGVMPNDLRHNQLWWNGPDFLQTDQSSWPINNDVSIDEVPEMKKESQQAIVLVEKSAQPFDVFARTNDFHRMVRIMVYVLRFAMRKHNKATVDIEPTEYDKALLTLVKIAQKEAFDNVVKKLRENKPQLIDRKVLVLSPFLDHDGIMRVGGRLSNMSSPIDTKHQIILPAMHPLTTAVIRSAHTDTLHGGPSLTLFKIRQKFWIINGRQAVRKITTSCLKCTRVNPKLVQQYMGNKPKCCVDPEHDYAFYVTGVDYCGPFMLAQHNKRSTVHRKAYAAVFVCMATKAIHIELVGDLTTKSFLAALARFTSRRGLPNTIMSDNGKNFVGAHAELQDVSKFLQSDDTRSSILSFCHNRNIKWQFIPVAAPHFGGLWESGVRSLKYHLKRIAGDSYLDYEEMTTLLTKIEAILNSRPLTIQSDDVNDPQPLTPGHFLIMRPLVAVPELDVADVKTNRLQRWDRINQMSQTFWRKWRHDYLHSLQMRYKWNDTVQVSEGQFVLLKDDNLPPLQWPFGRIERVHSTPDGHVRVVDIRTSKGIIPNRPVNKLCFLPVDLKDDCNTPCSKAGRNVQN